MTREEAVSIIEERIHVTEYVGSSYVDCVDIEALRIAIKALEQEQPKLCEDAVSREMVSKWLKQYGQDVLHGKYKFSLMYIWKKLMDLPSVTPKQRWIPWDSGKFPEESGTYTVTAYDGTTKRVTYAKYQKRLKRWELTGARAYWRVLAWQPLPEPYREGET